MDSLVKFSKKFLRSQHDHTRQKHPIPPQKKDNSIRVFPLKNELGQLKRDLAALVVLSRLRHPNLVGIDSILQSADYLFAEVRTMPFTLADVLLRKGRRLRREQLRVIMYQVVLAVDTLHKHGIEHLDLRPENIYVDEHCRVRVGGFGNVDFVFLPTKNEDKHAQIDYFTAPESVLNNSQNRHCGFKADVWALGCVLFELLEGKPVLHFKRHYLAQLKTYFLLLGKPPASNRDFIKDDSARRWVSRTPEHPPKSASSYLGAGHAGRVAKRLLDKMLQIDPTRRISTEAILRDSFFEGLFDEGHLQGGSVQWSRRDVLGCHPDVRDARVVALCMRRLVPGFVDDAEF